MMNRAMRNAESLVSKVWRATALLTLLAAPAHAVGEPVAVAAPSVTVVDADADGVEQVVLDGCASQVSPPATRLTRFVWFRNTGGQIEILPAATQCRQSYEFAAGTHFLALIVEDDLGRSSALFQPDGRQLHHVSVVGGHPSLFLNAREVAEIQAKAGRAPYTAPALRLLARVGNDPGPNVYSGPDISLFRAFFYDNAGGQPTPPAGDSRRAADAALAFALTPDDFAEKPRYAQITRDYLLAWSDPRTGGLLTNGGVPIRDIRQLTNSRSSNLFNVGLFLSLGFVPYAHAYDLIHDAQIPGTSQYVLSPEERFQIEEFLRRGHDLIRQGAIEFRKANACHQVANHLTRDVAGLTATALMSGRPDLALEAIGVTPPADARLPTWLDLVEKAIYRRGDPVLGCDKFLGNPTFDGEIVDRYRNQGGEEAGYTYSILSLTNLMLTAEMAAHRGMDLYRYAAPTGESLRLSGRYYAYYQSVFGRNLGIFAPNRIRSTGYEGEISYLNDAIGDGFIAAYELLSHRYHDDPLITRAFDAGSDRAQSLGELGQVFFGKYYDPSELVSEFHLDGVLEGWGTRPNGSVAGLTVQGGAAHLRTTGGDPIFELQPLAIEADDYGTLEVRLRITRTGAQSANQLFQVFAYMPGRTSQLSSRLVRADGQYQTVRYDLASEPSWFGRIEKLRIDPGTQAGLQVDIDFVRLLAD